MVPKTRLELARPFGHYTLNVARLPIPPLGPSTSCPEQDSNLHELSSHGPQPCASTNSAIWALAGAKLTKFHLYKNKIKINHLYLTARAIPIIFVALLIHCPDY